MKKIFLILVIVLLVGCGRPATVQTLTVGEGLDTKIIKIITIDGCQYLYGDWGNLTVLTHKGNCNNHVGAK